MPALESVDAKKTSAAGPGSIAVSSHIFPATGHSRRIQRPAVMPVVAEHVDEAIHLRHVRSVLIRAANARWVHLDRLDRRIEAHLDGISLAGTSGDRLCRRPFDAPSPGIFFIAAVRAIGLQDPAGLNHLLALARALPECRTGLSSAFGWASVTTMQAATKPLFDVPDTWYREVAMIAHALHGIHPGTSILETWLRTDTGPAWLVRLLRTVAMLGCAELKDWCADMARSSADPRVQCEAARAGLLLGERMVGRAVLHRLAATPGPWCETALGWLLKVVSPDQAQPWLHSMHRRADTARSVVRLVGVVGDTRHIPWLIDRMESMRLGRLAGEAFSLLTGADIALLDLERKPPAGQDFGPTDDPAADDVAMDADDGLPWPDVAKVAAWWKANADRFTPGVRHFMGRPPTPAHCLEVLRTGYQRQRIAAAEYLCLLRPGTPLFNTAAPAWRQQRLLARMG